MLVEINWLQDYKQDFICPKCEDNRLCLYGSGHNGKKVFICQKCKKITNSSCDLKKMYFDPELNIVWYYGQKMDSFICPKCSEYKIFLKELKQISKKLFKVFCCSNCGEKTYASISIDKNKYRIAQGYDAPIKPFIYENDIWDLRTINACNDSYHKRYRINFSAMKLLWFKKEVKKYIYYLCQLEKSYGYIEGVMVNLRCFCNYLFVNNTIFNMSQINRGMILDFISYEKSPSVVVDRLSKLNIFFITGNLQGWFSTERSIIRKSDYPKIKKVNPDPISDTVREQIENKLHLIPDPIARMWIIAFFGAMRPSELALLKKDCLIQEGANWKIVWNRQKVKDKHSVPITRVIASVVQQQQEYISRLWGSDWDYLFCHYHNVSATDSSQSRIKPVKNIMSRGCIPLKKSINCLIKAEDIRDENGQLAKFNLSLLRSTRLTQLFEAGHDLSVVSAWAVHKKLATTSLHYTKVSCELIEKEAGHIQKALFNADGKPLYYESMPKSFWENPTAHQLDLIEDNINTPIYGYCSLPLDQRCDKFRACYTCSCFVATQDKLSQYKKVRSQLKEKENNASLNGHDVLVEQFGRQAEQLDKIIAILSGAS